ncbi:MAG: hypothetical protein EOO75_18615, partial [Myxococcales bacterium]
MLLTWVTGALIRGSRAARGWLALGALVAVLLSATVAAAYTPPPIAGHVNDTSGQLAFSDRTQLDSKLARFRQQKGDQVAVLVVPSLGDEPIEDVAHATFNSWKLGEAGKDNGVLLVIAIADRRMRIETGRGVGDRLTDLQSNEILRERVGPRMKQNDLRGAIDAGTDGIIAALGGDPVAARPGAVTRRNPPVAVQKPASPIQIGLGILVGILVLILFLRNPSGVIGFLLGSLFS